MTRYVEPSGVMRTNVCIQTLYDVLTHRSQNARKSLRTTYNFVGADSCYCLAVLNATVIRNKNYLHIWEPNQDSLF
jgi:hypothetical protein